MIILKSTMDRLIASIPEKPPEMGGILGGSLGAIRIFEPDAGIKSKKGCSYSPDVGKLNQVITQWIDDKIDFMGLFHTHYFGVRTLSEGDIKYIHTIMFAMPDHINRLYFPIVVFPEKEIVGYMAERVFNGGVQIKEEEVIILTD